MTMGPTPRDWLGAGILALALVGLIVLLVAAALGEGAGDAEAALRGLLGPSARVSVSMPQRKAPSTSPPRPKPPARSMLVKPCTYAVTRRAASRACTGPTKLVQASRTGATAAAPSLLDGRSAPGVAPKTWR
jgi:hypothetical protein